MNSFRFPFVGSALALLTLSATTSLWAIDPVWEVNIVGDMYAPGRDFQHPTPEKPAYYYPLVMGFQEMGAQLAGDVPPPTRDTIHNLAAALAQQGYIASREIQVPAPAGTKPGSDGTVPKTVTAVTPPPSLLIVFQWGSLRAETLDGDPMSAAPSEVINKPQMLGLLAGKNLDMNFGFDMRSEKLTDSMTQDQYFLVVSAYDYNAYFKKHKVVRLWVSKISLPSLGENLTNVMPTLIKQGSVIFGRETEKPIITTIPAVRSGTVTLGTAVEVAPSPETPQTPASGSQH